VANLKKNVLVTKGLQILPVLFTLCILSNLQARAQYPGGGYYTPTQQPQQPGTATPQATYPQSYQQPAQPTYQQPVQPAQSSYQQYGYQSSTKYQTSLDSEEEEKEKPKKKASDHEQAVGEVGLALLGIMKMPIVATELDELTGFAVPRLDEEADVVAPTVGLRYWTSETFGIEGGLGLGFSEGSLETATVTDKADTDLPSTTAFTFHVGVPIALLYSGHFVFEVVPIVNGGFSSGTVYGDPATETKWDVSTFLLQIGSRLGAEIHFGFLGVEQLAVQASLGFQFSYLKATVETTDYAQNKSSVSFGTTAGRNPWDLFSSSLSAIYYIY
jgi:hypothetical protein